MKKTITEREADFKAEVQGFVGTYPQSMLDEFFEYWTEPNKSGSKMRWEREATWDLKRRLSRWANNGFGMDKKAAVLLKPKAPPKPQNEIEELDAALNDYKRHPSEYTVEKLEKWYNLMTRERLFKEFTRGEVHAIQAFYNSDKAKCRGACVMRTFDFFALHNFTFTELQKARANQ